MGVRQILFGRFMERVIIALLIVFLIVSIVIIIKNKINLTEKEGMALYLKGLGEFGKNMFKNIAKITSYVVKQEWIPNVKVNGSNISNTSNINNSSK